MGHCRYHKWLHCLPYVVFFPILSQASFLQKGRATGCSVCFHGSRQFLKMVCQPPSAWKGGSLSQEGLQGSGSSNQKDLQHALQHQPASQLHHLQRAQKLQKNPFSGLRCDIVCIPDACLQCGVSLFPWPWFYQSLIFTL